MAQSVVLIHGMWCTAGNWQKVRQLLSARGYHCVVPSLPAHDASSDQPLQVRGRRLLDYLGHLEQMIAAQRFAAPPVLIGHGMGAALASQLAPRIGALAQVLLTPTMPVGFSPSSLAALTPQLLLSSWNGVHKPRFEWARRYLFNGLAQERQRVLYETLVHESVRAALELGLGLAGAGGATVHADGCPSYVVSCGRDRLVPARVGRRLTQRRGATALRHYPQRGHWVIDDDDTEEMLHGICSWLRPFERRAEHAGSSPAG